eukprot:2572803-Prymnesium_polylepis.1
MVMHGHVELPCGLEASRQGCAIVRGTTPLPSIQSGVNLTRRGIVDKPIAAATIPRNNDDFDFPSVARHVRPMAPPTCDCH